MISCLSSCPWEAKELSKGQLQQTKLLHQVWNLLSWKLLSLVIKTYALGSCPSTSFCERKPAKDTKVLAVVKSWSMLSKTHKGWITCKRVFFGDCFKKYICIVMYRCICVYVEKKNVQPNNGELSFIWGKMKTIARETASQITVRNCSEEVGRGHGMWLHEEGACP